MKGEADFWSTEQFSIYPEDYEALEPAALLELDPELAAIISNIVDPVTEVDQLQQLSLAMLQEDSGTTSYFDGLLDSLSQLQISGSVSAGEAYVPILPQVEYSQIFRGVYDFQPTSGPRRRNYITIRRPEFEARRPQASRLSRSTGRDIFSSTQLSDFGNPRLASNLPENPRNELLIATRNYSDTISDITPMIGSFGTLAITVELPSLPSQSLASGLDKYFELTSADKDVQEKLEQQTRQQNRQQRKMLKRLRKAQSAAELRRSQF